MVEKKKTPENKTVPVSFFIYKLIYILEYRHRDEDMYKEIVSTMDFTEPPEL